jgi:phasin
MAKDPMAAFEIPPEMRKFAEQSVTQARQAFDGFMAAANSAVSDMEGRANMARAGAKDVSEKALTFAQRNIAATFEHAQKLVRAKDAEEIVRLQAEYVKAQAQALNEQAKELGQVATKAAAESAKPR